MDTQYSPSASFTPRAAFCGNHISEHAYLGPVPATDDECRKWLTAGLELSLANTITCVNSETQEPVDCDDDDCNCECCFYDSLYDSAANVPARIIAALDEQRGTQSLRDYVNSIASIRYSYWCIAWGSGHSLSDGTMVCDVLIECAPLSRDSAELGGGIVIPHNLF